jgi:hypothetical protein
MAVRLPTASRNAGANAIGDLTDAGPAAGTLQIRTGAQPASANDAASGTLLVTFTMADPAFGAASTGVKTAASVPRTATGAAAGTAGWARLLDSTGATVLDGSVTATGGGGDITMDTTTVSVGLTVNLTGLTLTMPAG